MLKGRMIIRFAPVGVSVEIHPTFPCSR